RQMAAGAGRALTRDQLRLLDELVRGQESWLYRFAGEIAARRAVGRPFSAGYLAGRSRQYGGVGWQAYWQAEEGNHAEYGIVVVYRSRDDGYTCSPCLAAERDGPYLPASPHPWPGEVCLGRGYCRCELEYIYDPVIYEQLF